MQNVTAVQKKTETHMGLLELSPKSIENEVPSTSRKKNKKSNNNKDKYVNSMLKLGVRGVG